MKPQNLIFLICTIFLVAEGATAESPKVDKGGNVEKAVSESGLLKDFDTLGGNDILYQKAKALEPDKNIEIVQNRVVSRSLRHELLGEFASVLDGDSYVKARSAGVNYQFHLNPRWSFGLKYEYGFNELTEAAERSIQMAIDTDNREGGVPDMDWLKEKSMATVSYYPIYGKVNFFNQGILHFDIYGMVGAGQAKLRRSESGIYMGGLGMGMWLSQHLSARVEFRYETYEVSRLNGDSFQKEIGVGSLQLGYML
ncbi:MAG: outer membrane beta-barrel domain-containing protein [Bdellovibrionales bacterium]|nr:outer membrane beta-barrel domain-containing protein [Bdellovibrionales bacterium]